MQRNIYSFTDEKVKDSFAQENPARRCRQGKFFLQKSLDKGFIIKCRSWSCSEECKRNAANKLAMCLEYRLSELPSNYETYRGALMMPSGASPAEHRKSKDTFLLALRRWAKRHGHVLELQGKLHATKVNEAHWDIVAFSDAPYRKLHDFFCRAWRKAGGHRPALVPMRPGKTIAVAKYHAKDVEEPRGRDLVPVSSRVMGLETVWGTRKTATSPGFWGRPVNEIWAELIKKWFKDELACEACGVRRDSEVTDTPESSLTTAEASSTVCEACGVSKRDMDITDTPSPDLSLNFDPANSETWTETDRLTLEDLETITDLTEFQAVVLKLYRATKSDPRRDRSYLQQTLPRSVEEAIGVLALSKQWGWSLDYTRGLLGDLEGHGVVRLSGQVVNGRNTYNKWYKNMGGR